MDNINQSYSCPRCRSVFPLSDKTLHDSICTGPIFFQSCSIGSTLLNPNMNNNQNNINNNSNDDNDIERIIDDNGNITETKKETTSNGSIKTTITVKDKNGNIKNQSVNISNGNNSNNNMLFSFSSFNSNMPNNTNILGNGLNNIMNNMMNNVMNNINNIVVNNSNFVMNDENMNHGLDPQILNNLLVIKSDLSELSENETTCIICMENYKNEEDVIYLPCQHLFHKNCLFEWFKINDCCPICKLKLTVENTDIYA